MGWGYFAYVPRKTKATLAADLEKLRKKNPNIQPIILEGTKLAKSWWAQAWNKNLESYADYENRIGRGRTYVRKGAVLDLTIAPGEIHALVQGTRSQPYEIVVKIKLFSQDKWETIVEQCSHKIGSLGDLASGHFPKELMDLFTDKLDGLFPSPKEISFDCSCPDWASMCKHIAAVLYGIGARFDSDPALFFVMRGLDFTALIKKSVDEKMKTMLKNAGNITGRVMTNIDTYAVFGV